MTYSAKDAVKSSRLKEQFGEGVVLFDEQEESVVHEIIEEFAIGGKVYAVLQSAEQAQEDEVSIFLVVENEQGELELETIDDDDEWENVAEIYDEMAFPEDED